MQFSASQFMNPQNFRHRPLRSPGTLVKDPHSLPGAPLCESPFALRSLTVSLFWGEGRCRSGDLFFRNSLWCCLPSSTLRAMSFGFLLWQVGDFAPHIGFLFQHVLTEHVLCSRHGNGYTKTQLLVIIIIIYQTLFINQAPCQHFIHACIYSFSKHLQLHEW